MVVAAMLARVGHLAPLGQTLYSRPSPLLVADSVEVMVPRRVLVVLVVLEEVAVTAQALVLLAVLAQRIRAMRVVRRLLLRRLARAVVVLGQQVQALLVVARIRLVRLVVLVVHHLSRVRLCSVLVAAVVVRVVMWVMLALVVLAGTVAVVMAVSR